MPAAQETDAKRWLSRYSKIQQEVEAKKGVLRQISRLRDEGEGSADAQIDELGREIQTAIHAMVHALDEIYHAIERLSDEMQRVVLNRRYICGEDWHQIAAATNYSESRLYEIHGQALEAIGKVRSSP